MMNYRDAAPAGSIAGLWPRALGSRGAPRKSILPAAPECMIEHGDYVLRRNIKLYIVDRTENETASGSQVAKTPFHLGPDVVDRSMRQDVLAVTSSAPKT
jgi:hypothetical protein